MFEYRRFVPMKFKSNPYDYRRRLPHVQRSGKSLFITFHTLGFHPLSPDARDITLDCCLYEDRRRVRLYAAVVMPEHVHLLLDVLRDEEGAEFPLRVVLHTIKSVSAHRINRFHGKEGPVWQEESLDHVLRSNEHLKAKIEYIAQNPVRRGLVESPSQYRWLWVNAENSF